MSHKKSSDPHFKSHFEKPLEEHPFDHPAKHFRRMRKFLREHPEFREKFKQGRKFRKRDWGLRKRLTVIFAFVALAAVFLVAERHLCGVFCEAKRLKHV